MLCTLCTLYLPIAGGVEGLGTRLTRLTKLPRSGLNRSYVSRAYLFLCWTCSIASWGIFPQVQEVKVACQLQRWLCLNPTGHEACRLWASMSYIPWFPWCRPLVGKAAFNWWTQSLPTLNNGLKDITEGHYIKFDSPKGCFPPPPPPPPPFFPGLISFHVLVGMLEWVPSAISPRLPLHCPLSSQQCWFNSQSKVWFGPEKCVSN